MRLTAVQGVQRLEDGGLFPHYPSRLVLKENALRYLLRRLERPTKVLGHILAGPPCPPPSYDQVHACIQRDASKAFGTWYALARSEFADLTGMPCKHKQQQITWRHAAELVPQASDGGASTQLFRMWRTVEQKTKLICRVVVHRQQRACDPRQHGA